MTVVKVMKMNKKTMISIQKLIQLWKEELQIQKEFLKIQPINQFKI